LPFAVALSLMSAITGIWMRKTGMYLPAIWFGLVFMTLGFGLFIDLGVTANWAKIIIFQIIAGIGVGPNFQSPLISLQSHVPQKDIATATATFGFVRNLSTSVSVVVGGVVFQNQMQKHYQTLLAALGPTLANELKGGSAGASVGIVAALPPAQQAVARLAFWQSLRTMWIMYVCFAAAGIFVSIFIGVRKLDRQHEVTKTGLAAEELKRKENLEQKKQSKDALRDPRKSEEREKTADDEV